MKKPTRTLSGVSPIAVMIKPQDSCKWGCIYCPFTGLAAKSYTGEEPAALRARQFNFDPYLQTKYRIEALTKIGHNTQKNEIIVMGGTFLAMEQEYKEWFIKRIYDAVNGEDSKTLEEAKKKNETAERRIVGLTIETRPDICFVEEMLRYGATRCELGVQHIDDEIYKNINRGHTVKDVVDATRNLKEAAFKVLYHVMPGLPGSSPEKDVVFVKKIFEDEQFRPDMIKIYPTLVIKNTILYEMMEQGEYTPYSSEEAAEIISEFYRYIPEYVRVMRIQRDIPAPKIERGVKKSNLRELVEQRLKEKNIEIKEIRYREIGRKNNPEGRPEINILQYAASKGKEYFIAYEYPDKTLLGFIRLRIPTHDQALIRELHIYGKAAALGKKGEIQHKGIGKMLLEQAEEIAKEHRDEISIISGVGVREYYRKFGYTLKEPYMWKRLSV